MLNEENAEEIIRLKTFIDKFKKTNIQPNFVGISPKKTESYMPNETERITDEGIFEESKVTCYNK